MINIREAVFDDFQAIRALKDRYGLESPPRHEWEDLWKENPAASDVTDRWPIGWVLEDGGKQIVGYHGNIPIAYELGGKRLVAAAATSFVVDEGYRRHSILLTKSFFSQDGADLLLMTTADYGSGRVYSAFKAQRIPADSYDIALYWITHYRRFASCALLKKRLPLGNLISYPLSMVLWGTDRLTGRSLSAHKRDEKIQCLTGFDERFDIFWDGLRRRYPDRLLRVRSRRELKRHFRYAIANNKIWIFTHEKDSRVSAYAIFLRQDSHETGMRRVRLIDLQSIDENPRAVMGLISAGIMRSRESGIDAVEAIGFNSQKRGIFKRQRPYQRRLPSWSFLYRAENEDLANRLKGFEAWDPCLLDGDSSI